MFSSDNWFGAGAEFYNGVATQSLRIDEVANANLSWTPSSAGNRKKWTFSTWIKRSALESGGDKYIFGVSTGSNNNDSFMVLLLRADSIGCTCISLEVLKSTKLLRDTSAWYHVLWVLDTANATPSNRMKIYVNGDEITSWLVDNRSNSVLDDTNMPVLNTEKHHIGRSNVNTTSNYNGYLAYTELVEGQALTPSDFTEVKNGVLIPKAYTGDHGTYGFRLEYKETGDGSVTASSTTIGADTKSNATKQHWNDNNLDSYDSNMPDSPENNFATANNIRESTVISGSVTLSEGNLQSVDGGTTYGLHWTSNFEMSSGKWYWEVLAHTLGGSYANIGICNSLHRGNTAGTGVFYGNDGKRNPATFNAGITTYGASYTNGDIIGVAFDADNETVTFYKNNASQGAVGSILTQENGGYFAAVGDGQNATTYKYVVNFGQDSSFAGNKTSGSANAQDANGIGDFYYSPPSGYLALCTANISDDDLPISPNAGDGKQADDYFSPTLYTSDNIGAGGTQSVTGVGFQPDWVWIKNRDSSGTSHTLFDSVRTAGKMLQSDNTSLEASNSQYGYLSSFDSDGFTLTGGTTNANFINQGTDDYVSWNWKANGGTTSTIAVDAYSAGVPSIASSVSANTDAGFSIVSYTGNSTIGATVGHGLSSAPQLIFFKNRTSTAGWATYAEPLGATKLIYLDLPNSAVTSDAHVNNTAPSTTVITLHDHPLTNTSNDYVAYCFHSVEGYSKIGSYTGNGLTGGTFVYTGFRPAWVLVKNADVANSWRLWDSARPGYNLTNLYLTPDNDGLEGTINIDVDFLSNGFKLRGSNSGINGSGNNIIYMAFAENPFKYANAR